MAKNKGAGNMGFAMAAFTLAGAIYFWPSSSDTALDDKQPMQPDRPALNDFDPLGEELKARKKELEKQFKGISQILGTNYVGRCLTGGQVKDFSEESRMQRKLTDNQKLLVKLYDKRRETAMGRYINRSQTDFNTISCVENNGGAGHLGLYADWLNVTTVNLGNLNNGSSVTAKQVMNDPRLFNLALRTAYEEIAHAWQGNTQKSIAPPHEVHALHQVLWTLAVEAQAKLVTFMALQEHRERGDAKPWNTALEGRSVDSAQMNALQKVLDAHKGKKITQIARENPTALAPVFKAFFTDPMPRKLYERHVTQWALRSNSKTPISNDIFKEERGALPGMKVNFLEGTDFSISDPKVVKFFDKAAERMIREKMERVGAPSSGLDMAEKPAQKPFWSKWTF